MKAVRHLILLALLFHLGHVRADWRFAPSLDVGAAYSNNIFLAVDGDEEADWAYLVIPKLVFAGDGKIVSADIRYQPEAYFFADNDEFNEVFHELDASGTATLVQEALYLYASASNTQSIVSPAAPLPSNNLELTANRVGARVVELRPYWEQRFGSAAQVYASTRFADIRYDESSIQGATGLDGTFRLNNLHRERGFTWGLNYEYQSLEYDTSGEWEYQRASAELGHWLSDSFRVFASGGKESPFDDPFNSDLEDSFWEAGFAAKAGRRSTILIAGGERSFGNSVRAEVSLETRRSTTTMSYSEGPTTQSRLVYDRRPIQDPDDPSGDLDRPGQSQRFLLKRGELRSQWDWARSSATFSILSELREDRISDTGEQLEDEELYGVTVRWEWQAGAKTTLGVAGSMTRRKFGDVSQSEIRTDDRLIKGGADLRYRISKHFGTVFSYAIARQESKNETINDYYENQFRVLLTWDYAP